MKDDTERKLDTLFAAARSVRPDTSDAEHFFEARLMARIRERREPVESWFSWAWRLTPALATVVAMLGILTVLMNGNNTDIFASMANDQTEYQVASYLEGE